MRLVNTKTGVEIKPGDRVTTFRGETRILGSYRHPYPDRPGSTGRVVLNNLDGSFEGEYFPGVIDAQIVLEHECTDQCRKYVADIAAPGYGQSWKCEQSGRSFVKVGGEFYDTKDLNPGDFELSIADVI